MARIRSIKPEFVTDGDTLRMSDSCALFYILLWNFCDDEGKHRLDLDQLVAELGGRWHRGKIKLFVSCLVNSGQLRINSDSTWLQVVAWFHQKIDKPKQPSVKASDLQWFSHEDSAKALEQSRTFGARIGSDRRDRIGSDQVTPGEQVPAVVPAKISKPKPVSGPTWEAYSEAYRRRYHTDPVRNATVNSKLASFVKRIGEEEAPFVAAFYVQHNSQFYVRSGHGVGPMLADAEKLRTEWATGRQITNISARDVERRQNIHEGLGELWREAKAREAGNA